MPKRLDEDEDSERAAAMQELRVLQEKSLKLRDQLKQLTSRNKALRALIADYLDGIDKLAAIESDEERGKAVKELARRSQFIVLEGQRAVSQLLNRRRRWSKRE
ncbi:MAG: hypothetical protein JST92_13400 [Deltaproteobacteria bacterium]|nr:hypothetical protein [Deltaproteobacteria bacterium]